MPGVRHRDRVRAPGGPRLALLPGVPEGFTAENAEDAEKNPGEQGQEDLISCLLCVLCVPRGESVMSYRAFKRLLGETSLELIAPRGNEGLSRFLDKRGPGLHHIAIEVEGIEAALAALKAMGVPLVDESPRVGARGHKVAFLHPRATGGVLVELVEPSAEHAGEA